MIMLTYNNRLNQPPGFGTRPAAQPARLRAAAAVIPEEEIRLDYPSLPVNAVPAAIAYAAELAKERVLDLPA